MTELFGRKGISMAKRKKKTETEEWGFGEKKLMEQAPTPVLQSVSTRNLERPKGSIRIVRGRKDAK